MNTAITTNHDELWRAVLDHDARFDGKLLYGVRSTGVFCRPTCPSRRPKRNQVIFFRSTAEAQRAGFRPCRRCRPDQPANNGVADVIDRICRYIDSHLDQKLSLAELARVSGYSPFHLQRAFKRALGISPRQYADSRRMQRVKSQLKNGGDVTGAIYDAGYGSSSRLYERANGDLGMTPATYGRGGIGMHIRYTTAECALGRVLVAVTDRGICAVRFGSSDDELALALSREFPAATIEPANSDLKWWVRAVVQAIDGQDPPKDLPFDLRCTAFQRQVWEVLRAIPLGITRSYAEVASAIGQPGAARAVARACATNPVAVLIPCHRVTRTGGALGGYRWGVRRKRMLLQAERASRNSASGAASRESTKQEQHSKLAHA